MSGRNAVRKMVPWPLWHAAGFLKRLGYHYRQDRSEFLRIVNGKGHETLYVTPSINVHVPQHINAVTDFTLHSWYPGDSRDEVFQFLELMKGTRRFFDIGAASGLMSALYVGGNSSAEAVASLEPDPYVFPILERTAVLNGRNDLLWTPLRIAVGDSNRTINLPVSARLRSFIPLEVAPTTLVDIVTLDELSRRVGFIPDIIKIDVESFEYEIITGGIEFISKHRPALQLEVHWDMLEARGKRAEDFLGLIADIGYRPIKSNSKWTTRKGNSDVTRIALRAS